MNISQNNIHFITSKDNEFFKKMKSYMLAKNRTRDKVILVEGKKNFQEAAQALNLRYTLINEGFCLDSLLSDNSDDGDIPPEKYTRLSNHLFNALADTKSSQGIIGVFDMPDQQLDLTSLNRIILLEGVQDPGNVGTIIRSAFCLGYQAVLLDEACAAAFSPKVIRSSMGALFHLPCATAPIEQHLNSLKDAGFSIIGSDLHGDDLPDKLNLPTQEKFALLVGSEGQGLSETALDYCDYRYKIPMANEAAESLNVAVASGIMMYQLQTLQGKD
jgi:TrmH family RNA methyltransferase